MPVDATPYEVRQVFYPSKDGTQISMFIVAKKDVVLDGNNPVLLYGYGGFDVSLTPARSPRWRSSTRGSRRAACTRCPTCAAAASTARRGTTRGRARTSRTCSTTSSPRPNIWCANKVHLAASKLAIRGGSNGGLLVGAALTQRPELFGAVICAVPLLDMVRYHLYGSGKTWIPEYGDPEKPKS